MRLIRPILIAAWIMILLGSNLLLAQNAKFPISVEKEKKTISLVSTDEATLKEAALAEYMNLVANEMRELLKTQALDCSWAVQLKIIPKEKFKLIEMTLEDKDNTSAANKIIRAALPNDKEEFAEQSKATAKRLLQLFTCTPKS